MLPRLRGRFAIEPALDGLPSRQSQAITSIDNLGYCHLRYWAWINADERVPHPGTGKLRKRQSGIRPLQLRE
jgi:hypothetical protein